MQILVAVLIALLTFLHYQLWLAEDGVRQTYALRISIQAQTEENAELAERNHALAAEVEDLKRGFMAIEERARADMGMTRPDETFYRLLDRPLSPSATSNKLAPPGKPGALPRKSPATVKSAASSPRSTTTKPAAPVAKASPSAAKPAASAAKPASPASRPTPSRGAPQRRE